mgnify:CR=1 FL=1
MQGREAGPPVVKLHGDLLAEPPDVVLTRRDYRQRLYGSPAYTTFLKSLFATSTVLYLGFSFTDAYLNELRSEILALVDYRTGDRPLAYAVVNATGPWVDRFLDDLRASVDVAGQAPGESRGAPLYGVASSFPVRGVVADLLERYLDRLYEV